MFIQNQWECCTPGLSEHLPLLTGEFGAQLVNLCGELKQPLHSSVNTWSM